MSDDNNIITLNPPPAKVAIEYDNIEERIYNCFHAEISFDQVHKKNCIYCLTNEETGTMLFEILARDMQLAAKNKNLILTIFDMKQCLAVALTRISQKEYEMAEATKETGAGRSGEGRGLESGESETSQGSPADETRTGEVISFPRKTTED